MKLLKCNKLSNDYNTLSYYNKYAHHNIKFNKNNKQ
jgi:hypothetical protein